MRKAALRLVSPTPVNGTVPPRRRPNSETRDREHLTEAEVERLMKAVGKNRYGHRDATMILKEFRKASCRHSVALARAFMFRKSAAISRRLAVASIV